MFLFFDGYVHHFDADAIGMLLADNIFVFVLKSQDSDSDQLNDNGPNALVKSLYGQEHDKWLAETAHAVPFTPYFLNPLLVRAWQQFEREARAVIIKAAEKIGLSPFNPDAISYDAAAVSKVYDLVAADRAVAGGQQQPAVQRIEAPSPQVLLQLKAAASPGTQQLILRKSAVDFFEQSWVMPAQELQRALKEQRELKATAVPLEIDRAAPPDTSVGLWITTGVQQQLANKKEKKVSAPPRARTAAHQPARTYTPNRDAHPF